MTSFPIHYGGDGGFLCSQVAFWIMNHGNLLAVSPTFSPSQSLSTNSFPLSPYISYIFFYSLSLSLSVGFLIN